MSSSFTTPKKKKHRRSISEQLESINISPSFNRRNQLIGIQPNNKHDSESETIVISESLKNDVDNKTSSTVSYASTTNETISEDVDIEDNEKEDKNGKYNTKFFKNTHSRESILKQLENFSSILVIILEQIISSITLLLPDSFINFCTALSRLIFSSFESNNETYNHFILEDEKLKENNILQKVEKLRNFSSFHQICQLNGFIAESHLAPTEDGFKLTIHRLNPEDNGFKSNGKAIYLQHGLLMTSDVWCVMLNKDDNLPFRLCELGFDVFLGNNRGNKYSNKHDTFSVSQKEFWNFSIDEFALYDTPASINYILNLKKINKLIYIGFSQGCSQILSSVSINNDLNEKIEKLILIAPATTPKKLSNWLINSIINFDPQMIYMLFGRKILMKSVMFWRRITYPPMFVKLIDIPNDILFDWKSNNIDIIQKLISYYHLYSTTSVKCVVHWFQIIKSKKFQMYQEQDYFQPFEYPTAKAIKVKKLMIIYGMNDSLVDIDVLVSQLPEYQDLKFTQIKDGKIVGHKNIIDNIEIEVIDDEMDENYKVKDDNVFRSELRVFGINKYEHLDLLWGKHMNENVIKNVIEFL